MRYSPVPSPTLTAETVQHNRILAHRQDDRRPYAVSEAVGGMLRSTIGRDRFQILLASSGTLCLSLPPIIDTSRGGLAGLTVRIQGPSRPLDRSQ